MLEKLGKTKRGGHTKTVGEIVCICDIGPQKTWECTLNTGQQWLMCVCGSQKLARKPLDPKVKMTDKSMARNTSAE